MFSKCIFLVLQGTFSSGSSTTAKPKWMKDLEADDISMVQELGSLTPAQLLDKVRQLQNLAYQLGLEEGESDYYEFNLYDD